MNNSTEFNAIIEISKGSRLKYEVNKKTGRLFLDRVLPGSQVYPYNYGYIDGTLDGDGDPLDVVLITQEVIQPGVEVPVRVIGAMKMIDSGEKDTKLICVMSVDPRYNEWVCLSQVPQGILNEIEDFFSHYKKLNKKEVVINGWIQSGEELQNVIKEGFELYEKSKEKHHGQSSY